MNPATGAHEKNSAALNSVAAAFLLTGLKVVVGVLSGSLGILAEAAHSGLDLAAAVVTCLAVRAASKPPDRDHAYGHGKVENLSALVETLLLLATCAWIIYEALQRLIYKNVDVELNIWAFLIVIFAILAGNQIHGILGMLLAIPLIPFLKAVTAFFGPRLHWDGWDGGAPPLPGLSTRRPPSTGGRP